MTLDPLSQVCMVTATAGILFIGKEFARANRRAEGFSQRLSREGKALAKAADT